MNALNDIVKEYSETTLDDPEGNGSFLDIADINNLRDAISACTCYQIQNIKIQQSEK